MRNVPKLRFKEFNGDWEEKKLGEITTLTSGGTPSTLKKEYWNGSIKWMSSGELNLKFIYDVQGRITDLGLKNSSTKIIPKECILIGLAGQGKTRGTVAINFVELCTNQSIASIFPNFDCFKPMFLYYNLDNRYEELRNLSTGSGGRGGLNLNILKNISSFFPNLNEQQKIADFLFSVDKKISITEEKLGLFKDYKKGIMKKIFNQELRFKDSNGNDYPEWEEKRLGDLITSQGGKALEKYSDDNGKYKFISIGNYSENSTFIDNGKRIDLNSETKKQLLKKNELVMILNDKTKTGNIIGRTLLIEKDDTYIYNQRSQRIICKKDFLPQFAYVLLNSSYRNNIIQNAQGGTQIYINFSTIENFSIELPCLEEQQKIADFLSSIDNKIENLASELENLKEFKKGLLERIFV